MSNKLNLPDIVNTSDDPLELFELKEIIGIQIIELFFFFILYIFTSFSTKLKFCFNNIHALVKLI